MDLSWIEKNSVNPLENLTGDKAEYIVHYAEFEGASPAQMEAAIYACIDKAASLLDGNIRDDSMFFLFEWDLVNSILTVVVTDKAKEKDSSNVVKCSFAKIEEKMSNAGLGGEWESGVECVAEDVQFWIKDYLTTCPSFLQYSLVAAFHKETRFASVLL